MGTYADAYMARMRECARAMSRDLAPMKARHLEIRLVEHDAELAERGFESGLLAIEQPNRVRTADPYQGTAWLVEGDPAHLCWEYLPHLAAYVELVEELGYPASAIRFETPDPELNLDLAVLDPEGKVLVLGEVKAEPRQIASLETLVPSFHGDPGKPLPLSAGGPHGATREAWKCRVPGLMEALIPRKDESHGSTEEVSRGASGAGNQDGGRSAA